MADPDLQIRGGEGRAGHPDPEVMGGPTLKKIFFRPVRPQLGLKIRGGKILTCDMSLKLQHKTMKWRQTTQRWVVTGQ